MSVLQAQNNTTIPKTSSKTILPRPPPSREHSRFKIHIWFLHPYRIRLEYPRPPISVSERVHLPTEPLSPEAVVFQYYPTQSELFLFLEYVIENLLLVEYPSFEDDEHITGIHSAVGFLSRLM